MGQQLPTLLEKAINELQIELNEEQIAQLLKYLQQLERWNKTYNLTAIESSEEMLIKHIVDSLSILTLLEKLSTIIYKKILNILDVGSVVGLSGDINKFLRTVLHTCVV